MTFARYAAASVKPLVFVLALGPVAWLTFEAFFGDLGANPVEAITHSTGEWALRFLLVTLAVTPLRHATGWLALTRLRRMLGLYAFFYLCLHFSTYVWLDAYFDLAYILDDIAKRLYITAGFTSFVLLVPLAVTSTNAMVRRLGPKRWRALHRLAYAATMGGVLHFVWLVKADLTEPLIYAVVLAALLLARLPSVSAALKQIPARRPRDGAALASRGRLST